MKLRISSLMIPVAVVTLTGPPAMALHYPVVDTGQTSCYDASDEISCPADGEPFFGQDAQHTGNTPAYTDNGDGTVTDRCRVERYLPTESSTK